MEDTDKVAQPGVASNRKGKFAKKDANDEEISDEEDLADDRDLDREAVQRRLYSYKKPTEPVKKELPKLDDRDYLLLKEHVRTLKGKSPRLRKVKKVICWMDDPEIPPKNNHTSNLRTKRIQENLDDRKESEEDPFSSRCVY